MADTDSFNFGQWVDVPDDPPVLPPVDEDVCGLKDIASYADLYIDEHEASSGLLLGPCRGVPQGMDMFNAIPPHPPTLDSFPSRISYPSFPPALSPDSSPISIASSTPWLSTPTFDASLANLANFTQVDVPWHSTEAEETCSTIHFVDEAGNSLEDIVSQVQDMMPEDIATNTPQVTSDASLLLPNAPSSLISPPHLEAEAVLGSTHYPSPAPFSPHVQSLFTFSPGTCYPREKPFPEYSMSPSLSPLSTLSVFSQSPSASTNPLPFINYSSLSPALSSMPLSDSDEKVGTSDSVSSPSTRATSLKSRRKRGVGTFGNEAASKISRTSKAKNDDDEWNPESERIKRPRVVALIHPARKPATSTPNSALDESPMCEAGQDSDSEEQSDVTNTCCELCGQGFTRESDYFRHMENSANHPETRKVWPCPYCDGNLGRRDALGRHIRTIHPGRAVLIPKGTPGNRFPGSSKEPSLQRMGPRKTPARRQLRKDTRRYR